MFTFNVLHIVWCLILHIKVQSLLTHQNSIQTSAIRLVSVGVLHVIENVINDSGDICIYIKKNNQWKIIAKTENGWHLLIFLLGKWTRIKIFIGSCKPEWDIYISRSTNKMLIWISFTEMFAYALYNVQYSQSKAFRSNNISTRSNEQWTTVTRKSE